MEATENQGSEPEKPASLFRTLKKDWRPVPLEGGDEVWIRRVKGLRGHVAIEIRGPVKRAARNASATKTVDAPDALP